MEATKQPSASRANAFDALRLVAATAVLVSHSWVLSGDSGEPHIGRITLGQLAVLLFFGISGYLITQSWLREPSISRFALKRGLRIYPALIAVVLFAALVLGPLATTLSLREYFTSGETFAYIYENILMLLAYTLPGVFTDNPYNPAVNGSLWTLPHELKAYAIVAALGFAGLLRRRDVATVVLVTVSAILLVLPLADPFLLRAFCVGAILQMWRDRIPLSWSAAAVGVAAWLLFRNSEAAFWIASIAVPYASIVAAYRLPQAVSSWTRRGDISYGVYVWAFPVQQTIMALWLGASAIWLTVLALPITFLFAILSWKLIERPALRLKRRTPRPVTAEATPEPEPAQPVPAAA